eukprot:19678-Heterococcus_DN1.PRE.1
MHELAQVSSAQQQASSSSSSSCSSQQSKSALKLHALSIVIRVRHGTRNQDVFQEPTVTVKGRRNARTHSSLKLNLSPGTHKRREEMIAA